MAKKDINTTSTYGDSEKHKTETYGNSEHQKTEAYNSKQDETAAYSDLKNKEFKSSTHGIGIGDKLVLRDNEYAVTEIISEGTGEAVIYKIEDKNKNCFALKLYFEFSNSKEEPNYETLKRIKGITDPDILKLHDFGVGNYKYQNKYCYEVSDYADGGDLFSVTDFKKKYNPEFIEKHIVQEIFNGIVKLHDNKIYHCDLKPSNIFYKDKEQTDILIGDYGSAKAMDLATEKDIRKTSTVKGTSTFLPPEQARGVISEKNDYYSLGFILLNLLYPESLSTENDFKQTAKEKFEKIIERQYNSIPIIDYNPQYKRLNNLIEGLTLINHKNRFGRKELEKWLNGEEVEVKYTSAETSSVQPLKLGYATIRTDKDLIEILETKDTWWEDLFENVDTYFALKAWLGSYQDIVSRKIFDELIHFYKPLGKEYVKEAAIRYFDPEREIRTDMNSFNFFTSGNIKKDVESYISRLDDLWKITNFNKIKFYIFQLEFSLNQVKKSAAKDSAIVVSALIDKLYSVFGLIQKPFDDYKTQIQTKFPPKNETGTFRLLINLFYVFNPQRTFRDSKNSSVKTIEDLGLFYVRNESSFEDKYLKIEKEKFLEKLSKKELNTLDYKQFIFEIFKDQAEAQIELASLTFDKHRDYKVNYKFYKSLNTFLSQKQISKDFTSRSGQNELYESRRGFFQSFKSEGENFISNVSDIHNITTLTEENLSHIRKKFRTDSWNRYLYIYSGQIMSFLLLLPLTFFVFKIADHQLHFDKNWKPYFMGANAFLQKTNADNAAEQKIIANSFLSTISPQNIKIFSSGINSPARGNRHYSNSFRTSQTQYINFEVNIAHKNPDSRIDFVIYFTIYRNNQKFAESAFQSYILPEWSSSYHTGKWGDTKPNFWKKGNYRVEMKANDRNLGSQSFKITGNTDSGLNSENNTNPSLQSTEVTGIQKDVAKQYKWINCENCNGRAKIQANGACPTCSGSGQSNCSNCNGLAKQVCSRCEGKKQLGCSSCNGAKTFSCSRCIGKGILTCGQCGGDGTYYGVCDFCNGKGTKPCTVCNQTGKRPCSTCNQTGYQPCSSCTQTGYKPCNSCSQTGKAKCNACSGKGQVTGAVACPKCNGKGQVQVEM